MNRLSRAIKEKSFQKRTTAKWTNVEVSDHYLNDQHCRVSIIINGEDPIGMPGGNLGLHDSPYDACSQWFARSDSESPCLNRLRTVKQHNSTSPFTTTPSIFLIDTPSSRVPCINFESKKDQSRECKRPNAYHAKNVSMDTKKEKSQRASSLWGVADEPWQEFSSTVGADSDGLKLWNNRECIGSFEVKRLICKAKLHFYYF